MFGSDILDVAIGLMLLFLMMSLISSAFSEIMESVVRSRAKLLHEAIFELFGHTETDMKRFYTHPLIYGLYFGEYGRAKEGVASSRIGSVVRKFLPEKTRNLPAYIPARNFAVAAFDIVVNKDQSSSEPQDYLSLIGARRKAKQRTEVSNKLRDAVILSIDTSQYDFNQTIANLRDWYDSGMDRVSGHYKRRAQSRVLFAAVVATVLMNVNAITVARHLYRNGPARRALVVQAESIRRDSTGTQSMQIDTLLSKLQSFDLPIGWTDPRVVTTFKIESLDDLRTPAVRNGLPLYVGGSLLGWLITVFAISMGAPFWFDVLNKFMVIRSTVKPREKSPEEGSEDRQSPAGATRSTIVVTPSGGGPVNAYADSEPEPAGGKDEAPTGEKHILHSTSYHDSTK